MKKSPLCARLLLPSGRSGWTLVILPALILLAFWLRLHRLDFQPLWGDEGWSFYFAAMPPADMLRLTAVDIHPPLYYALLSGWLRLVGTTPESARLLSVVFGTLLVPLAYRVGARLFDRTAGLFTAALVTFAPFAIYYSQEVRMYGLVTLLSLGSVYFFSRILSSRRDWPTLCLAGYVLNTTAALYTMYYAVFLFPLQAAYLVKLVLGRRPGREYGDYLRQKGKELALAVAACGLLYLPWVIYAGGKLVSYVQGKRIAEGYVSLDLFQFFAAHLAAFSVGHLSPGLRLLGWAGVLFVALGFLGLAYRGAPREPTVRPWPEFFAPGASLALCCLFFPLLLGYLVNLVYPFTPLYFERTLMLAAPGGWLLVGGGLAWIYRRCRAVAAGLGAVLLTILLVALFGFYNVPRYQDEDYRAMLTYVGARSSPEDVILVSYQWQLGLFRAYLPSPHPELYVVPGWGQGWAEDAERMQRDLQRLVEGHPKLWFPAYQKLGRLWESDVERFLTRIAFPAEVEWDVPGTKLSLFGRGDDLAAPAGNDDQAGRPNFENRLEVTQILVGRGDQQAGRSVIPVCLVWRKLDAMWSEHRVALRLVDASGRTWAGRDSLPQAGETSFVELEVGRQLTDHHGVFVPAGTPPGEYELRLSVVGEADERPMDLVDAQGQPMGVEVVLARVRVTIPAERLPVEALPVQFPVGVNFDSRVQLVGYSQGDGPFMAGDLMGFTLFWQALENVNQPYIVFAQLQDQESHPVALSETPAIYATDLWPAGMLLRDPHAIQLPATLPAGTYRLAVGLLRPDGSRLPVDGGDQVVLSTVNTIQRPHEFESPSPAYPMDVVFGEQARLVGYDLPGGSQGAGPGDTIEVVLYWQALEPFQRGYTVFAHLVNAEGHIFGQRDSLPGGGEYPTTGWVPGEYLADPYSVPVNPGTPAGEYWLEVGFYDALDGSRLQAVGADGALIGDHVWLSATPINVR